MFHAQQSVGEILDWSLDYRPALCGNSATTSTWAVSPATGMTLAGASLTSGVATIVASSDQPGAIFVVTNTVTVSNGDTLIEKLEFYISP